MTNRITKKERQALQLRASHYLSQGFTDPQAATRLQATANVSRDRARGAVARVRLRWNRSIYKAKQRRRGR